MLISKDRKDCKKIKIRVSYNQELGNINIKLAQFLHNFMIKKYLAQQEPTRASQLLQHTKLDACKMYTVLVSFMDGV